MKTNHHLTRLKNYVEQENFKGYDPYDALNSPLLKLLSFKGKYIRQAFIQSFKRIPINFRPLFAVKKGYNPKGLGLFLWGYAKLYAVEQNEEYLDKINLLLKLLDELKSPGYSGNCWGYNFDWQSGVFYLPKYTPTIVNSSFIGHALLDTYETTGNRSAFEMAVSIKDFLAKDLNRTTENGSFCFSYTPVDYTAIHNANVLGASLLIRLSHYLNDMELKEVAKASLSYTTKYQKKDGSWYYGESNSQQWIDSYHTGFNLQSMLYFLNLGGNEDIRDQFNKGVRFYAENFFLDDGTPKFYHNKTFPIDIHAPSQAITFFSRMGSEYSILTEKILAWLLKNMVDKKGYFYYQKRKFFVNKIPYIRWSQAWVFHALTEYELNRKDKVN